MAHLNYREHELASDTTDQELCFWDRTHLSRRGATCFSRELWRDGRLLHTYKDGVARVDGMLEDYGYAGLGLIALYRATGDLEQLRWARELLDVLRARFSDSETGTFFDTPADTEALLFRQRSLQDGPTPSGNAAAALLAFWLGRYFGEPDYEALSRGIASAAITQLGEYPSAIGAALQVGAPEALLILQGRLKAGQRIEDVWSEEQLAEIESRILVGRPKVTLGPIGMTPVRQLLQETHREG